MRLHNQRTANHIAKRLNASQPHTYTARSVVGELVQLCLAPTTEAQKRWQHYIGYEAVDLCGYDDHGTFLLALALEVRKGYTTARKRNNHARYVAQLADNRVLDITPLLQAYDTYLSQAT